MEPTLQAVQRDRSHSDTNHGLGIVIELATDGEEREGVRRLRLESQREEKTT